MLGVETQKYSEAMQTTSKQLTVTHHPIPKILKSSFQMVMLLSKPNIRDCYNAFLKISYFVYVFMYPLGLLPRNNNNYFFCKIDFNSTLAAAETEWDLILIM